MPKAIFDVEVNSDEFKEFSELFDKYQKKVQALPGAWGNVNKEVKSGFEAATAALLAQSEINRRAQSRMKDEAKNSKEISGWWKATATSTGKVTKNLYDMTRSLVRWTGIAGEIGGLLGLGGLWGLDRLAGRVGAGRRQAQGLGLETGEKQAFSLNYGRIVDADSYLSDINQALHDPASLYKLYAAGLTPGEMKGNTAQVGANVLDRYKALADQTDPQMLGAVLKARGGLMSLEDFERLKSMSPDEYSQIRRQYGQDRKSFALGDPLQKQWQDFNIQLERAGMNIRNAFIIGLTPLIPKLGHLSEVAAKLVAHFLQWVDKSGAMDKLGDQIERFATYLGSKEFHDTLINVKNDFVALGGGLHNLLLKLGMVPDNTPETKNYKEDPNSKGSALQRFKAHIYADNPERYSQFAGLLPGIAYEESRNRANAIGPMTKYGRAKGMYQLLDSTAAQYGVDPFDPQQAKHAAAMELERYNKKFQGDPVKALAAYNWGEGNVEKDIKRHGADWYKHLPRETSNYIRDILTKNNQAFFTAAKSPAAERDANVRAEIAAFTSDIPKADKDQRTAPRPVAANNSNTGASPQVKVEIRNYTGSDVITTTGQAAR